MRGLVVLVVAACAREPAVRPATAPVAPPSTTPLPALGTPAEVQIHAGVYDGYEVDDACRDVGARGVRGLGAHEMPPIVGDGRDFDLWATALQRDTEQTLGPLVLGVGFGIGCRDEDRGFRVYVRRFGEIDAVIEALGRFIRDRELGVRFLIVPSPRIVPL